MNIFYNLEIQRLMHVLYCFSLNQTNFITEDIYAWYFFANVRKKKQTTHVVNMNFNK